MKNKENIYKNFNEKENNDELENSIIINNDEYGRINDLLSSSSKGPINNFNQYLNNCLNSKNIKDQIKINNRTIPVEEQNKDKKNKIKINNSKKFKKQFELSTKNIKSIFPKISEDIYTKFKSKKNNEVGDISKIKEDIYNKIALNQYIGEYQEKEKEKKKN